MKKITLALTAIAASFMIVSCGSVKVRSYDVSYIHKQGLTQTPVITDLNVTPTKYNFTKTYSNMTVEQAKQNAYHDFIKEKDCDLIIQPQFSVDATEKVIFGGDKWGNIKVELSGLPAKYTNIRKFEPKDSSYFVLNKYVGFETSKPIEETSVKKSKVGTYVLYGVGALTLLSLLGSIGK